MIILLCGILGNSSLTNGISSPVDPVKEKSSKDSDEASIVSYVNYDAVVSANLQFKFKSDFLFVKNFESYCIEAFESVVLKSNLFVPLISYKRILNCHFISNQAP